MGCARAEVATMQTVSRTLLIALAATALACSSTTTTPPGGKHTNGDSANSDSDSNGDGGGGTLVTIYDVQTPGGSASAVGTGVRFQNVVVTAIDRFGSRTGVIYVQESAGGAYSGVALFSGSGIQVNNATLQSLVPGDIVNVDNGEVDEYAYSTDTSGRSLTEIISQQGLKLTVTKVGSGSAPTPEVLLPWDLAASDDESKKWEGVLIEFENVAVLQKAQGVSTTDLTLAEMRVTGPYRVSSSLTALLDGATPPAAIYPAATCFKSVTGIVDYFFDYKLLPRSADDIVAGGTNCLAAETSCTDHSDNDHNGYADCLDFNCQATDPADCVSTVTVANIQNGTVPVNTAVTIEGVVVTAIVAGSTSTTPKYVWVEEPAGGSFSGIAVYKPTAPAGLALGDVVSVTGSTTEYSGGGTGSVTEIQGSGGSATIAKTGTGTVPTALVVSPATLVAPPSPDPYDGLLVEVQNVKVTNTNPDGPLPSDFGQWTVSSSNLYIDDAMTPRPTTLAVGDCYTSIVGVFDYSFGNYKIEPRSAADITKGTGCP